jgi:peptidoglycan/xylan/chitin deacetylase (PgdA/CDA1 family)
VRSKQTIEQRIGQRIDAISVPSGRWNRRVLRAVRNAGYVRMYTSDPFFSRSNAQLVVRGRINVTQNMSSADLGRILKKDFSVVARMRARHAAKAGLRRMLGEATYHRLWATVAGYSDDDA